ncbi:MAG: helix-turn-helix transcriptional regulator [Methylobacterium sp.]|nr:helix-turn-helix transcriptional regulator [Methylobacterium sp.]
MTTSQFKEWRKRMRLSQEAAAEALGLSRNTIVRYETDHETPQVVDLACAYLEEHGAVAVGGKSCVCHHQTA